MDTPKKKPGGIEAEVEGRMSKLEESVMGKLQKASTRGSRNRIKDEGTEKCSVPCPSCLTFCCKDQGHYYDHLCRFCGLAWH